jgi:hypothetical protein
MSLNETVCLGLANGAEMHIFGTAAQRLGCAHLRARECRAGRVKEEMPPIPTPGPDTVLWSPGLASPDNDNLINVN